MPLIISGRAWGFALEISPGRASRIFQHSHICKSFKTHARHQTNSTTSRVKKPRNPSSKEPSTLVIDSNVYPTDSWTNVPASILSAVHRRLHVQPSHPLCLTRQIIESHFKRGESLQPPSRFTTYNNLPPVVTVAQNFDSLGFQADHPGRSRTDTYYINHKNVLRTHTSAHQADIFRENYTEGYLISADVYRRDAIDRSHNPVFHQMEGARMWDRRIVPGRDIAKAVRTNLDQIPAHNLEVDDPIPTVHEAVNPLQEGHHILRDVEAIVAHLKRSLEGLVFEVIQHARRAAAASGDVNNDAGKPVQVRWVEAYFPFTSPSWELEVYWEGDWLEILGCGVVKQDLLINAGLSEQIGWAFGLGLDRIAMLMFGIPDIRLLWSQDPRFLSQFTTVENIKRFVPFSKHPPCYKDVAFWIRSTSSPAGGGGGGASGSSNVQAFHENDMMEIIREVAGSLVENVRLVDEFSHPTSGRKSVCYRINYRSLERTLRNEEVNELHNDVTRQLVEKLGVEIR